jgi:hypothetical protein
MMGWMTIIKTIGGYIAGLGASVFMAWLGIYQLYRWYTTGGVLTSFRGMDNLTKWQLITYETTRSTSFRSSPSTCWSQQSDWRPASGSM